MAGYLARRMLQALGTLLLFWVLLFFLIQAQPGDFAAFYIRPDIPKESQEAIAASFGLDKPAWQQFVLYVNDLLHGDMGVSFSHYPRTVVSIIGERLPRTLLLFLSATVISYYLGFVLGKRMGWRRGSLLDNAGTVGGVYVYTAFLPWFALLLIWLFSLRLGWLPVGKFVTAERWSTATVTNVQVFTWMLLTAAAWSVIVLAAAYVGRRRETGGRWAMAAALVSGVVAIGGWWLSGVGGLAADILRHALLPVLTLSIVSTAGAMLLTRSAMLNVLREDYVLAARARGLPDNMVRDRYAARNALLPVVTSFVFSMAFAIDGSVIIEGVFSWPGMGLTLIDAALAEDLPLAVGAFVFTGFFALAAHVVADVLAMYLDPRLRRP